MVPHKEFSSMALYPNSILMPATGNILRNTVTSGFSTGLEANNIDGISMTGSDGTTATLTPRNGDLEVHVSPGVRSDLKTKER